jgi:hypothetical protein
MTTFIQFIKSVIWGGTTEFKGFESRTSWRNF